MFWDIMQRIVVITDVSGQPICLTFKGQEIIFFLDLFALENGTNSVFRNFGKKLLLYAV
jgi:hypothetical protein